MRFFTILSLLVACVMTVNAQSSISDGYIKYTVSIDSEEPAAAFFAMGTTLELAFKGTKTKAVANVASGTNSVSAIADHTKKAGIALMDVLGEKKAMKLTKDDFDKASSEMKKLSDNPMRWTDDTKTIAGYTCQKVLMKHKESGASIIIYVTDKINPKGDPLAQNLISQLKGFPLGIVVRVDGNTVRLMAEKVSSRTPSDGAFSTTVPSGYELTSREQLEENAKDRIEKNR